MGLIFVTSNPRKVVEANKIARAFGVELQQQILDIDEIQSDSPEKVVIAKAKSAYEILKQPVVVNDTSWSIPALNGFPGAYMKDVMHWFTPYDWLNLIKNYDDKSITAIEHVAYCDGEVKTFGVEIPGHFANEPRGKGGNSIERVVYFSDGKTISERHGGIGGYENSVLGALGHWEQFFEWYLENMK